MWTALAAYAAGLAIGGPRLLATAGWADRAPRPAIAAWQALCVSIVTAVCLAGLVLIVPTVRVSGGIADLLDACVMALRAQYATPGGIVMGAVGGLLALTVTVRLAACLIAALRQATRRRRGRLDALAILGRPDPGTGAVVIDHPVPVAYPLPGSRSRIVLSTAALAVLDDDRLAAVLAHERAHLRYRHDLVIATATALRHAFPFVAAFATARDQMARLVELAADDTASRTADRLAIADAILALARNPAPVPAPAAAQTAAGHRVRRLIAPRRPLGRLRTLVGVGALTVILGAPAAIITQPALAATHMNCCTVGSSGTYVHSS